MWFVQPVKGKKFGFSREAVHCPCLRLLIYRLVKEISHLSLFIYFLHIIFFSLTLPRWNSDFPQIVLPKNEEEVRIREKKRKVATGELPFLQYLVKS